MFSSMQHAAIADVTVTDSFAGGLSQSFGPIYSIASIARMTMTLVWSSFKQALRKTRNVPNEKHRRYTARRTSIKLQPGPRPGLKNSGKQTLQLNTPHDCCVQEDVCVCVCPTLDKGFSTTFTSLHSTSRGTRHP